MERDAAIKLLHRLLAAMKAGSASDLYLTAGFPPAMKVEGQLQKLGDEPLDGEQAAMLVRALMNDRQGREFEASNECNFAIAPAGIGRFRVNCFVQQGHPGAVLRLLNLHIPTFEELELPAVMRDIALAQRGLVLVVGATGAGKNTSLAAMVGHRNEHSRGHIVTIEDPIEYVHAHRNCVVTQREIGVDSLSWEAALKNTLRQAPDVIQIGEIRARDTMEYAIQFAETGHLVLATLHANNANQALDRIVNFFPEEKREQVLMDLSLNLRAILSQRLIRRLGGGRIAAFEILLNSPLVSDLIFKGDVAGIKEVVARSTEQGMKTFDQFLFDLFEAGRIGYEEALRHADSQNELRLRVKLESRRKPDDSDSEQALRGLRMQDDESGRGSSFPR